MNEILSRLPYYAFKHQVRSERVKRARKKMFLCLWVGRGWRREEGLRSKEHNEGRGKEERSGEWGVNIRKRPQLEYGLNRGEAEGAEAV
jgi:hypothetical protein